LFAWCSTFCIVYIVLYSVLYSIVYAAQNVACNIQHIYCTKTKYFMLYSIQHTVYYSLAPIRSCKIYCRAHNILYYAYTMLHTIAVTYSRLYFWYNWRTYDVNDINCGWDKLHIWYIRCPPSMLNIHQYTDKLERSSQYCIQLLFRVVCENIFPVSLHISRQNKMGNYFPCLITYFLR
jgi:hypothetical protein